MTRNDSRRGMVLVAVLWMMAMLSALAMAASTTFRSFVGIMTIDRDRLQADALLTAGLETAAGIVAQRQDRPLQDMETTITLSTGSVVLRLADQGGRIDIGKAPAEVLSALFSAVGAPAADAEAIARNIVAFRNPDDANASTAASPSSQVKPDTQKQPGKARPFTDVHQLANIPGMPPDWVKAIVPLTTVFGSETVNPLTAPPDVLAAMPGMGEAAIRTLLDARRFSTDPARILQSIGPAQRNFKVAPHGAISVRLSARLNDGYAAAADAVFVILAKDREPYRVLVWTPFVISVTGASHAD